MPVTRTRLSCREHWVIDPAKRSLLALVRTGDIFVEKKPAATCATGLLPGLVLDMERLFAAASS